MSTFAQGVEPPGGARILSTTNSTNFKNGVCTGVAGATGNACDTLIVGIIFLQNAASVTATLVGCQDDTGTAANLVISGNTTALDAGSYYVPLGFVNDKGPLSITASVASKVIVVTEPTQS